MGVVFCSPEKNIKRKKQMLKFKRYAPFYILALPGLVYLFVNNYMPMPGIILAFKKYNVKTGIYGSPWAGFSNFKYLFSTQDAYVITRNTLLYNLAFILIGTLCSLIIAIILSEIHTRARKLYQSSILLPFLISYVIVSYLVFAFLSTESGFLNNSILAPLGIEGISWYTEKKYWPFILIFVNTWRTVGYTCIIYLATIVGFDRGYYEAAEIDGAGKWQQIMRITLPLLQPTIILLIMLSIGRIFYSDFGLFYQVPQNSGALYSVTNTIDTYVYRGLLELGDITMSAAAGVYQSIVGFILVFSANMLVRKIDRESALF